MSATFEQWIKAVFDHQPAKRHGKEWYWGKDFEKFWESLELSDAMTVSYLTRLFRDPQPLRPYSLDQVAQAIWFLVSESSPAEPSHVLVHSTVTLEQRVAGIRAIADFFAKFVALAAPGPVREHEDDFHGACYMWWDIFPAHLWGELEIRPDWMETFADDIRKTNSKLPRGFEPIDESGLEEFQQLLSSLPAEIKEEASRFRFPDIEPEIHQACLETMQDVLSLPAELCQLSALHGLNHWHLHHAARVEQIIDDYLANSTSATLRMREYAARARMGACQ